MKKVIGLDSLRFVLAFVVILGHLNLTNLDIFNVKLAQHSKTVVLLNGVLDNMFPGITAVIVFFIISGFCIHYPYSTGKNLNVPEFYLKRIVRIGIPAVIAFVIYLVPFNLTMGVIWSLICEVIYYFLYPIILKYKEKYFNVMLISSFVLSYLISINYSIFSSDYNGNFHRNGFFITWIVGLPVWLLGVDLASKFANTSIKRQPAYLKLVFLRLITWATAILFSVLRFHAGLSYTYTLPVFALLAYVWLKEEIWYYSDKKENKLLEYGGLMSYSMYLIHAYLFFMLPRFFNEKGINKWLFSAFQIIVILLVSWLFYILIEKKAHKLAKSIKLKLNLTPAYNK